MSRPAAVAWRSRLVAWLAIPPGPRHAPVKASQVSVLFGRRCARAPRAQRRMTLLSLLASAFGLGEEADPRSSRAMSRSATPSSSSTPHSSLLTPHPTPPSTPHPTLTPHPPPPPLELLERHTLLASSSARKTRRARRAGPAASRTPSSHPSLPDPARSLPAWRRARGRGSCTPSGERIRPRIDTFLESPNGST